jgi:carbamoylphosphate synthase small subunit
MKSRHAAGRGHAVNGPGDPAENTGIIRELRGFANGTRSSAFDWVTSAALARGRQDDETQIRHRGANTAVQEAAT